MPTYDYECSGCANLFEVTRGWLEEAGVVRCAKCGAEARKRFSAPTVIYKGSGFYTTDYKSKSTPAAGSKAPAAKPAGDAKDAAKSGSKADSPKPDSKPAAKKPAE